VDRWADIEDIEDESLVVVGEIGPRKKKKPELSSLLIGSAFVNPNNKHHYVVLEQIGEVSSY